MAPPRLIDIGMNLTHGRFRNHWREVVQRAIDSGVDRLILTGTCLESSRRSIEMIRTWVKEGRGPNLFVKIGVHPHNAKIFGPDTASIMREMIEANKDIVVAVGECGLDYNRNFSTPEQQLFALQEQLKLACELQMPLFCHEREAYQDFMMTVEKVRHEMNVKSLPLPPLVVHCFTGEEYEAMTYIQAGFFIGVTGFVCMLGRGSNLRTFLPKIPLDRLMLETDAPFMNFKKKPHRYSEPADVVGVAAKVSEVLGISHEDCCRATTNNASNFFGLEQRSLL